MTHTTVETTYTVKPGDTLAKIAAAFLGDATQYVAIAEANGLNPNLALPPGTKIKIPARIPEHLGDAQDMAQHFPRNAGSVTQVNDGPIEVVSTARRIPAAAPDLFSDWRFWAGCALTGLLVWYFVSED